MSQNRIELLRSLYRAGQEFCRASSDNDFLSEAVVEAIAKVEQAVEAIAETGMFEPVSDETAAQRLKDALAEPSAVEQLLDAWRDRRERLGDRVENAQQPYGASHSHKVGRLNELCRCIDGLRGALDGPKPAEEARRETETSGEMFTRLGREIAEDMRAASKGKP
jgi:hypothetical protein